MEHVYWWCTAKQWLLRADNDSRDSDSAPDLDLHIDLDTTKLDILNGMQFRCGSFGSGCFGCVCVPSNCLREFCEVWVINIAEGRVECFLSAGRNLSVLVREPNWIQK